MFYITNFVLDLLLNVWNDLLDREWSMLTVHSSSALLNYNFLPDSICRRVNWCNNCFLACWAQRSHCEPISRLWPLTSCQLWKTVIIINSCSAYSQRATLPGTPVLFLHIVKVLSLHLYSWNCAKRSKNYFSLFTGSANYKPEPLSF